MFKSLLNANGNVGVDSLVLNIFIILGVVIAGALVLYFLWEIVSYAVNKSKKAEHSAVKEPNLGNKEEPVFESKKPEKEDFMVVDYNLDATPVEETVVEETPVEENSVFEEANLTEVDDKKAEEEKKEAEAEISTEEQETLERRAYLEARRQEIIKRMQAEMAEENKEEVVAEPVEEKVEESVATQEVKVEEPAVDQLEEERKALNAEKARYEAMVKELEAAKKALAEQKPETKVETKVETVYVREKGEQLSLEELKERLESAEERLRTTEKEFKQCKKEYTPLRRVWNTHEKDERKLRRKEALVAKQKVLLYGVNNYADIDEDKAKKLAEDLDLLDGLKLSVQHCEEVMKKNEERYPLLEKMYNVLQLRNEELKADIAYYKEEIAKLEADDSENA